MKIIGIESSCDETSAAVVEVLDGGRVRRVLSNVVASQIEVHRLYGGVVPEIASRAHTEAVSRVTSEALENAGISPSELDCVAVTSRPGLIGALLVGVSFAKGFAYRYGLPIVGVNHVRGHASAAYLAHEDLVPGEPFLALVASGGHTSIIDVRSAVDFVTVGVTRDDAIGEAFDKVARVMGLPYPGGLEMDRLCASYSGDRKSLIKFPSAAIADDTLDFSFSGLKTAVINHLHTLDQKGTPVDRELIAASFTDTVVSSVVKKLSSALDRTGRDTLVLAGGVAANSHLRRGVSELCEKRGVRLRMPPISLCGDNGAMIAMQGSLEFFAGNIAGLELGACAVHDSISEGLK